EPLGAAAPLSGRRATARLRPPGAGRAPRATGGHGRGVRLARPAGRRKQRPHLHGSGADRVGGCGLPTGDRGLLPDAAHPAPLRPDLPRVRGAPGCASGGGERGGPPAGPPRTRPPGRGTPEPPRGPPPTPPPRAPPPP